MIQRQVSTPQGFARAVSATRTVMIAGIVLILIGLGCIGMNLFQLGTASDWEWSLMTRFFFDADAIEFSGRRSGRSEMWRYIYVWAPVAVIPVGIGLLIYHFATNGKSSAGLFADFQSRGWIGRQQQVGLQVKNGNATAQVVFISHPSISDEVFDGAVQHYGSFISGLDKKGLKDVQIAAAKSGVLTGVPAETLMPGAPAGLTAAILKGKSPFVAVIPPNTGAKKFRLLAIKEAAVTPQLG